MTQLAAMSALRALESLSEAQSRSARPAQTQAGTAPADATARGPAVINEVQDIRKRFSAQEITSVAIALGSMRNASTPSDPDAEAQSVNSVLASIAARRDKGEKAFLIVVSAKEGGGIASVRSGAELAADLASDDPASMGSFTGADGKTRYLRDLIREMPGLNEALNADSKTSVADGVVKELRSYNPRPDLDEIRNLKLEDKKDESVLTFRKAGDSVRVLVFEATLASSAPAGYGALGAQA